MRELLSKIASFVTWHRRLFAALASAACVLAVVQIVAPTQAPGVPVLVVQRAVAAGATFTDADVGVIALPAAAAPTDALASSEEVVGEVAVTSLTKGTPVTPGLVLKTRSPTAGHVFVPIRLPDASPLGFIRPGDLVSVVAVQSDGTSKVVATGVRVAAIPDVESSRTSSDRGAVVVLEVPVAVAPAVSTAALQRGLSITVG